jgi:acetyl esterase
MADPDIDALRRDAAARAAARLRLPFDGEITEAVVGAVLGRWYLPAGDCQSRAGVVFLHGGYGVFGDLDLQDAYCRRIAGILGIPVLSIAYRLAPEAVHSDSVDDALAGLSALRDGGAQDVVLWGDSAGGAVALTAGRHTDVFALVLTNPNVDLRLRNVDRRATGGPDMDLSAWAFAQWGGTGHLDDAPDLAADVNGLPPVFVAVGSDDSLVPDASRLAQRTRDAQVRTELRIVPDAAHGFMSGPDHGVVEVVIGSVGLFLGVSPSLI